jgi:hypothetical protein
MTTKANFSTDNSSALQPVTRRRFLAKASASALSFSIIAPELVRGAEANSKVDIGLIGCGGRGQGLAPMFVSTGGYNMVAVADYFQDRTDSAGQKLGVPETKRFTGLNGYRKLLEQKLDAVMIESPPSSTPSKRLQRWMPGSTCIAPSPSPSMFPAALPLPKRARKLPGKNSFSWSISKPALRMPSRKVSSGCARA